MIDEDLLQYHPHSESEGLQIDDSAVMAPTAQVYSVTDPEDSEDRANVESQGRRAL